MSPPWEMAPGTVVEGTRTPPTTGPAPSQVPEGLQLSKALSKAQSELSVSIGRAVLHDGGNQRAKS